MDRALDTTSAPALGDLAAVTGEVASEGAVAQLAGALDSALPARVRCPEALLAPLAAALWQRRRGEGRAALTILCDDDETARELADEAGRYAPADEAGF